MNKTKFILLKVFPIPFQRGRALRAPDLKSGGPEFKTHRTTGWICFR